MVMDMVRGQYSVSSELVMQMIEMVRHKNLILFVVNNDSLNQDILNELAFEFKPDIDMYSVSLSKGFTVISAKILAVERFSIVDEAEIFVLDSHFKVTKLKLTPPPYELDGKKTDLSNIKGIREQFDFDQTRTPFQRIGCSAKSLTTQGSTFVFETGLQYCHDLESFGIEGAEITKSRNSDYGQVHEITSHSLASNWSSRTALLFTGDPAKRKLPIVYEHDFTDQEQKVIHQAQFISDNLLLLCLPIDTQALEN